MDVAVRHQLVLEAGLLVHAERSRHAVLRVHGARREQVAAVGGHRQIRMMGALPDECEEGQDAGPCAETAREAATARRRAFEPLQQAVQTIALVIEGVVTR